MNKISISISIVVYKPKLNVLSKVFESLFGSQLRNISVQLFIIDNSSEDAWHLKLENFLQSLNVPSEFKIQLIKSPGNIGYGKANNLILDKIESDYHLVMNPDVFVYSDTLEKATNYLNENIDIGLLLPAIYSETGSQQYLCKRNPTLFIMFLRSFSPKFIKNFFKKRINRYEMTDAHYNEIIWDIPFPSGCFMFFRTKIFKQLEGFDRAYFMYYEDADIGRRLLRISHSAYVPQVKIIHQWARGTHNNWRLRWITIKSGFIYWCKWGGMF